MADNSFMKERKLYAAYEKAKAERRKICYDLLKQGYRFLEVYTNPKYRKADNRKRKAFRAWDAYCQTRKE